MLTWIHAKMSAVIVKHTADCVYRIVQSSDQHPPSHVCDLAKWLQLISADRPIFGCTIIQVRCNFAPRVPLRQISSLLRVWAHNWRHKAAIVVSVPEDRGVWRRRDAGDIKRKKHYIHTLLLSFAATLMVQFSYPPCLSSRFYDILMGEIYNLCYLFTHCSVWQAEGKKLSFSSFYRRREQFTAFCFSSEVFCRVNKSTKRQVTEQILLNVTLNAEFRCSLTPQIPVRWHRCKLWLFKFIHCTNCLYPF